jgi:hypothetical protein
MMVIVLNAVIIVNVNFRSPFAGKIHVNIANTITNVKLQSKKLACVDKVTVLQIHNAFLKTQKFIWQQEK